MVYLKFLKGFLCVVCPMIAFVFLITILSINTHKYRSINMFESKDKIILLWGKLYELENWDLPCQTVNKLYFQFQNCSAINCIITSNSNLLKSIDLYDTIIFHGSKYLDRPPPLKRKPEQYYIFAARESPLYSQHKADKYFYNLTMTYRLKSDFSWYYGVIRDKVTKNIIAPSFNPPWKTPVFNNTQQTFDVNYKKNSKHAAWFVSHCTTKSKREYLVNELKKYIEIDVYGSCSNLRCEKTDRYNCKYLLDQHYKFYLAFENSLCKDYVTEKLFNALKRQVIPVVFGGANYSRFAPPHSYINVRDFSTVKHLAEYLLFLDKNAIEYEKYFWWKKWYEVDTINQYCELCKFLSQPKPLQKSIYDIKNYWMSDDLCEKQFAFVNT